MPRKRLRDLPDLATTYSRPHDHHQFIDHHLRVESTLQVARWAADELCKDPVSVSAADLSCGNGYILKHVGADPCYYGDYAPGWEFTGPIEKTINLIPEVDLFVNTETLEHVDDPDAVLSAIREKTDVLILSTPLDAWDDVNPEHVWSWGRRDIEDMLLVAGFESTVFMAIDMRPAFYYCFGVWACR